VNKRLAPAARVVCHALGALRRCQDALRVRQQSSSFLCRNGLHSSSVDAGCPRSLTNVHEVAMRCFSGSCYLMVATETHTLWRKRSLGEHAPPAASRSLPQRSARGPAPPPAPPPLPAGPRPPPSRLAARRPATRPVPGTRSLGAAPPVNRCNLRLRFENETGESEIRRPGRPNARRPATRAAPGTRSSGAAPAVNRRGVQLSSDKKRAAQSPSDAAVQLRHSCHTLGAWYTHFGCSTTGTCQQGLGAA